MHHPNGKRPNVEAKALHNMCCQPTCAAPATTRVASQVPLCEPHLMDVFSATNRLLAAEKSREGQYALLPLHQDEIAGPCPSCGICGYLTNASDKVVCRNADCHYEAWIDQFEKLRRRLLVQQAATQSVVYYIKFRDRIKIGTTSNLQTRMYGIGIVEMLYGFEPGDRSLERKRHRQFAPYRTVGEWFTDNQHIRAHINNHCTLHMFS